MTPMIVEHPLLQHKISLAGAPRGLRLDKGAQAVAHTCLEMNLNLLISYLVMQR